MKNILLAGGSGLIGTHIRSLFETHGYHVANLSRKPSDPSKPNEFHWNPDEAVLPSTALRHQNVIINLSGAGLGQKRWTPRRKEILLQSRLRTTRTLVQSILSRDIHPELFINASAIGYYEKNTNDLLHEKSPPGSDFLANVCRQWEQELVPLQKAGIPTCILRIGIVLAKNGGVLPKFIFPLKWGINPVLGKGEQRISWIHIEDVGQIFLALINRSLEPGVYNLVAPQTLTQQEFNSTAMQVMAHRALKFHFPSALIRLVLGEMASLVLDSQHVVSENMSRQQFKFKYPVLKEALASLLTKNE